MFSIITSFSGNPEQATTANAIRIVYDEEALLTSRHARIIENEHNRRIIKEIFWDENEDEKGYEGIDIDFRASITDSPVSSFPILSIIEGPFEALGRRSTEGNLIDVRDENGGLLVTQATSKLPISEYTDQHNPCLHLVYTQKYPGYSDEETTLVLGQNGEVLIYETKFADQSQANDHPKEIVVKHFDSERYIVTSNGSEPTELPIAEFLIEIEYKLRQIEYFLDHA